MGSSWWNRLIAAAAGVMVSITLATTPAFAAADGTSPATTGVGPLVATGLKEIVVSHTRMCMDVANRWQGAGAHIQQWTCNDTAAQRFDIVFHHDNQFSIRPAWQGGWCWDAGKLSNGSPILQQRCINEHESQMFTFINAGGGKFYIKSVFTKGCVNIAGASTAKGAWLILSSGSLPGCQASHSIFTIRDP